MDGALTCKQCLKLARTSWSSEREGTKERSRTTARMSEWERRTKITLPLPFIAHSTQLMMVTMKSKEVVALLKRSSEEAPSWMSCSMARRITKTLQAVARPLPSPLLRARRTTLSRSRRSTAARNSREEARDWSFLDPLFDFLLLCEMKILADLFTSLMVVLQLRWSEVRNASPSIWRRVRMRMAMRRL